MKRIIGLVLIGLGFAFIVCAPLFRFYVAPSVAVTPLNQYAESPAVGVIIKQLDLSKFLTPTADKYYPANQPATALRVTKGDVIAAEQESAQAQNLAIFDSFLRINVATPDASATSNEADGRLVTASTSRYAFGRQDSLLVNCCGANVGGDSAAFEGVMPLKWPFFVEQQSYDVWNDQIQAAVPAQFSGEEERAGISTYKFVQNIAPTLVPGSEQTVPSDVVGLPGTTPIVVNPYYTTTITTWVEPTTGAIVDTSQQSLTAFRGPDGTTDLLTFLQFELRADPAYVEQEAPAIKAKADELNLLTNTLPIVLLIAGIVVGVIGFLLRRTGTSESEEENVELLPPPASV
jgi:hypothetical protein